MRFACGPQHTPQLPSLENFAIASMSFMRQQQPWWRAVTILPGIIQHGLARKKSNMLIHFCASVRLSTVASQLLGARTPLICCLRSAGPCAPRWQPNLARLRINLHLRPTLRQLCMCARRRPAGCWTECATGTTSLMVLQAAAAVKCETCMQGENTETQRGGLCMLPSHASSVRAAAATLSPWKRRLTARAVARDGRPAPQHRTQLLMTGDSGKRSWQCSATVLTSSRGNLD